jgi:hypothetical protein
MPSGNPFSAVLQRLGGEANDKEQTSILRLLLKVGEATFSSGSYPETNGVDAAMNSFKSYEGTTLATIWAERRLNETREKMTKGY